MYKIFRNIFVVIIIILLIVAFSSSYNSYNIDKLAYVTALGIDIGEVEEYKITFQFTTGTPGSDSGSNTKSEPITNSVEASSIESAINLMNAYMARQLNLSHCKTIVFSEQIAINGIGDEVFTLINNPQTRPSSNIIVSKSSASDYIENSIPILENLVTKYYEIFPNSNKYTGYVLNATLGDFFNNLISNTSEPYAILGGVNQSGSSSDVKSNSNNNSSESGDNSNQSKNSSDKKSEESSKPQTGDLSEIKSSLTPFSGQRGAENLGTAVFKDDKLVGELSALDTLCLSIIQKKVDSFLISIPDKQNPSEKIDLMIFPNSQKVKVDIVNNSPLITFEGKFTGKICTIKQNSKYLDYAVLEELSSTASIYLENIMKDYLYKTSINYKSDINGFGVYALSNFLTLPEFEEFDWKNSYKKSVFNVTTTINIQSGEILTEK